MQMPTVGIKPDVGVSNLSIGGSHIQVDDVRRIIGAHVMTETLVGKKMTVGIVLEGFNGRALGQHALAAFKK